MNLWHRHLWKRNELTAIVFVLSFFAISVEVALPPQGDALAVLAALELVARAPFADSTTYK
jgi:hypothetical protein